MSRDDRERVLGAIGRLREAMQGDAKRLTDFTPEYRLRVGDFRVLFEVANDAIIVYRVLHRREAYR